MEKAQSPLYVCHRALFMFEAVLSDDQRDDMLCSALYAQLAADHKHSIVTEVSQWSAFNEAVLKGLGWVAFNARSRRIDDRQGADFTVAGMLDSLLNAARGGESGMGGCLNNYANALKGFVGTLHQPLSCAGAASGCQPSLQTCVNVNVALASAIGVMTSVSIHFRTTQPVGAEFFQQSFSPQLLTTPIETRCVELRCNERVFSRLRPAVLSKTLIHKQALIREVTS